MALEFADTFLRDAAELIESLKTGNDQLEIARALHSLKSGASFLGWENLEKEAHRLEESLSISSEHEIDWNNAAGSLAEIINRHSEKLSPAVQKKAASRNVIFSDLERRVLTESQIRGEHFYRLTCRIDPSEPLPYSRAYLLSSKLETATNLVKSHPPMDDTEADFSRLSFWFTTDSPESDIFSIANIDLIDVVELIQLNFDDILARSEVPLRDENNRKEEDATLIVDRSSYTETMQIAEELAWRLERSPGTAEAALSAELQRSLESLAFQPIEPMLIEIGEAVTRLAKRRGLKARFEWNAASGGLDASTLELLAEILRQLVRNSLRHGIETPEERRLSGKSETGVMSFHVERSGKAYRFRFEDDGKGLDEEAVMERAEREGLLKTLPGKAMPELLEILCTPGFSTLNEADYDGGRGMGLEMTRNMLQREFGSELELENNPGGGFSLSWSLPEKHLRRPYLVFKSDGRSWAIPANSVRRRGVADPSRMNASGQGYSIGGGLIPIVGPMGLRPPGTLMPYYLEIHHRGRRAALLVDDL
ncbi:MAG: Hpt domain-containing protein, partial [Spirochaetaceae bacterium]|nr:Hpt domain-containing protein [Spirochaetaceae bacterium]